MRCLARRRAPVMLTPSTRLTNSSAEGCSTSEASRTRARTISEPATSSRRSSFMVSTSGSSGIRVFIPARRCPILVASCRFARDEGGVALRQRVATVRSHRLNPEARPFEFCGQVQLVVESHAMDLLIPPVAHPSLAETHDPALHRLPLDVLLPLEEHSPVLTHAETPRPGPRRHLPRTEHVEDEDAPGDERVVNAPEKATKPPLLVLRIEKIIEDLADGRDGLTTWELGLEQRPYPELGLWHSIARELDHGLGDIDPQDSVAGVYELARPQSATAAEVHNEAMVYPVTVQDLHYARRRSEGELSVADVVDVRQVLPVPPRRVRLPRGYLIPL